MQHADALTRMARILVVEDDSILRMFIVDGLREVGYQVEAVATAAEALGKLRNNDKGFDGAVIDYGLPDRRGDVLAAEIRKIDGAFPMVIASGYNEDMLRGRFSPDEHTVLLGKPYDGRQLRKALGKLGISPTEQ
jgi:CheY-like chemotaxis protein